jgi:hypothetical protein
MSAKLSDLGEVRLNDDGEILLKWGNQSGQYTVWVPDEDYPHSRQFGALVVRAVNSHEALLEAAKNIENDDGSIPAALWEQLQKAIAQAEGGR